MPLIPPTYQPPFGVPLGVIPVTKFSGKPSNSSIIGEKDSIFFSPALLQQNSGNEILLDEISVSTSTEDRYTPPSKVECRVFEFGINSRTNDPLYRVQPKHYGLVAIMIQTLPPGPTTIYKIP